MKLYVDIDNTICKTDGSDYPNSVPHTKRIEYVNRLYDEGHTIHYWTARGKNSGKDWKDLTEQQLQLWGCKYHSIIFDKPSCDYFIDDKSLPPEFLDYENRIR